MARLSPPTLPLYPVSLTGGEKGALFAVGELTRLLSDAPAQPLNPTPAAQCRVKSENPALHS
jgi:hypothetical protein